MDSIITRIVALAEPTREKQYRSYLGTLHQLALEKKLADLEAEAGKPRPQASWRAGLRRAVIKIS